MEKFEEVEESVERSKIMNHWKNQYKRKWKSLTHQRVVCRSKSTKGFKLTKGISSPSSMAFIIFRKAFSFEETFLVGLEEGLEAWC